MTDKAWEDPRRVLRRYGLRPKGSFSQNFLVSPHAVERIVSALDPTPDQLTVELGPGLGTLTGALLRAGATVHAVDRDRDMLRVLNAEFVDEPRLTVIEGDAATVDLVELSQRHGRVGVVGNLPYAITGAIMRNLVAQRSAIRRAVIMVQREVAQRMLASPGDKSYGALTVFVSAAFAVEQVVRLKAGAFHPPPKVESAVLKLEPLDPPRAVEDEVFRSVVKSAFGQRRKTLRNALKPLSAADAMERAGVAAERRAETLSVEEFGAIADALRTG